MKMAIKSTQHKTSSLCLLLLWHQQQLLINDADATNEQKITSNKPDGRLHLCAPVQKEAECSGQCALCALWCTVFDLQFVFCSVLCFVHNVKCTMYTCAKKTVQCTVCSVQCVLCKCAGGSWETNLCN